MTAIEEAKQRLFELQNTINKIENEKYYMQIEKKLDISDIIETVKYLLIIIGIILIFYLLLDITYKLVKGDDPEEYEKEKHEEDIYNSVEKKEIIYTYKYIKDDENEV